VDYVNVKAGREALDRMLMLSKGRRSVPVIVEDGEIKVGYGGS
jgi:hypothetical protein